MQGTVVMLLALSGLGCHHKGVVTSGYVETCYSSGCYSSCYGGSSCYSSCYGLNTCYSSCYSSCYSGAAYSPADYSCYSCYSSCYSSPRHKHGLFGCKRKHCMACTAPAPVYDSYGCDPCASYGGPAVYGSYTPVYAAGQMGSSQLEPTPMKSTMPPPAPAGTDAAPTPAPAAPEAPSPGNPAPPATPPTPAPAPDLKLEPKAPIPGTPAPATN